MFNNMNRRYKLIQELKKEAYASWFNGQVSNVIIACTKQAEQALRVGPCEMVYSHSFTPYSEPDMKQPILKLRNENGFKGIANAMMVALMGVCFYFCVLGWVNHDYTSYDKASLTLFTVVTSVLGAICGFFAIKQFRDYYVLGN